MPGRRDYLIGLDSGTQSTTACAWNLDGRLIGRASAPQTVSTPHPGWAEQDPNSWWHSTQKAIRSAIKHINPAGALAIGIAFQRETFSLIDGKGRFLRPGILWLDGRAGDETRALRRRLGAGRFRRATGKSLDITCALPRLAWLARHEPDVLRKTTRWIDVGAALAFRLTGRYATCVSGADTCGMIGLKSRNWLEPYIRAAGLTPDHFPDLVEPGELIGTLTRPAARETGLPAGLPVFAAGGDGQVFSVGIGSVAPYSLSLSLGTSIVLGMTSPRAVLSPLYRTLLMGRGSYLLECVLQSGTYILKWFLSAIDGGRHDEAHWERLSRKVPPGCEELVTLPHWWGVRFPESLPDAAGAVVGWRSHHTRAHLYRSLLEGSAFELRRAVSGYEKIFRGRLGRPIRVGGGGATSQLMNRILAATLNRPLLHGAAGTSATALGAAAIAGVGAGVFSSLAAASRAMCRKSSHLRPSPKESRVYASLFKETYLPAFSALVSAPKRTKTTT